jgi:hypothetical protein
MQVFAIAVGATGVRLDELVDGVTSVGEEFRLDPSTLWQEQSESGRVRAAGIHHGSFAGGQRRYLARSDRSVVFFDGLPVASDGSLDGWDAAALAGRWTDLPGLLEGQFCAVRLDLEADIAEVLVDPLGLVRVYVAAHAGGLVASTSVSILARLLSVDEFDELGVSSFVGLGWAVGQRTLLRGVSALSGGSLHTLTTRGITSSRHFGPGHMARAQSARGSATELAGELTRLVDNAARVAGPVRCALTAGHDTRVMAALLQHAGVQTMYYTGGTEDSTDVQIARELAGRFDLAHEIIVPDARELDWTVAASRFIAQNDGLSSLIQLADYIALEEPAETLGLTLWGVGGEIGRAGSGALSNVSPNLPGISRLASVQQRLLALKIDDQGLLTASGRAVVLDYLERFAGERHSEGWSTRELSEAFYAFERVANWGATGPRRASGRSDLLSPYCTRPFIEYCFSLSPQERYLEAAHHRLLKSLSPDLLDHDFETPFPPQHPHLVGLMAFRQLMQTILHRNRHGVSAAATPQQPSFLERWLEDHIETLQALVDAADPAIWQLIDEPRLRSLLTTDAQSRTGYTHTLLRIATILWFLDAQRAVTARHAS